MKKKENTTENVYLKSMILSMESFQLYALLCDGEDEKCKILLTNSFFKDFRKKFKNLAHVLHKLIILANIAH